MTKQIGRVAFLTFVLSLTVFFTTAQDTTLANFRGFKSGKLPLRQNVVKSNFIPILVGQIPICGELRFTYERMLTHNQSLSIGASYNFPSLMLFVMPAIANPQQAALRSVSMRGGRLTLSYRYYVLEGKQAPEGLFAGAYFSWNFVKIKERRGNGSYQVLNYTNASAIVGYQIHLSKGVFLEFMGGLGYRKNFSVFYDAYYNSRSQEDFTLIRNNPFKNVKVLLQINLGFGF